MHWLSVTFIFVIFLIAKALLKLLAEKYEKYAIKLLPITLSLEDKKVKEKRKREAARILLIPFIVPFLVLGMINFFEWHFTSIFLIFVFCADLFLGFLASLLRKRKREECKEFISDLFSPSVSFPFQPDWETMVIFLLFSPLASILIIVGHFCLR